MSEIHVDDSSETKRRKVRKGTQSCRECKRRKVRCIFPSSTNTACNNCKRRGTICISQELPDDLVPSVSENQVDARLGRLEELIELALSKSGSSDAHNKLDDNIVPSKTAPAQRDIPVRFYPLRESLNCTKSK